jgi:hypothetical protein
VSNRSTSHGAHEAFALTGRERLQERLGERPLPGEEAVVERADALGDEAIEAADLVDGGRIHSLTFVRELPAGSTPAATVAARRRRRVAHEQLSRQHDLAPGPAPRHPPLEQFEGRRA